MSIPKGHRALTTDHCQCTTRGRLRILTVLDSATEPQALNLPGYALHPLKGDRIAFWAVTVKANWRIVFRFMDGDAYDVELTDYH